MPALWANRTIAVLASGPSLVQADVDLLRGRMPVLAVNDAVRLAPWADVLYSSDRRWWPHHKGVPSFRGQRYSIGSRRDKRNPFLGYPEILVLKNTGDAGLELDPSGLRTGKNSGYAAINLAVHFGARRILLLGYNMGRAHGKTHFFGEHPPGLHTPSPYDSFKRYFDTMIAPLTAAGVEVWNCSRETSLEAFPLVTLEDALDRVAPVRQAVSA